MPNKSKTAKRGKKKNKLLGFMNKEMTFVDVLSNNTVMIGSWGDSIPVEIHYLLLAKKK